MIEVLMTINQYAKHKGVHRRTVERWYTSGKVKALRSPNGKHWYIIAQIEPNSDVLTDMS